MSKIKSKTEIPFLETNLVYKCNLKCEGCMHFCPLVDKERLADPEIFRKDIGRLSELFDNINVIGLMGGEPLLHPKLMDFVRYAREAFPNSDVKVYTNGILLAKQDLKFWESCQKENVSFFLSRYNIRLDINQIIEKASAYKINIRTVNYPFFYKSINLNGDSDKKKAFDSCRKRFNCPSLGEGRIYKCYLPQVINYFNSYFGKNIRVTKTDYMDIYKATTAEEIINFLNSPGDLCSSCLIDPPGFAWRQSSLAISEWSEKNNNAVKSAANRLAIRIRRKMESLNSKIIGIKNRQY